MANPSLQIGNGKFAIKENDLLGYSSSGTRFFPIPITMTRATLGSRVNPSGLIEDVELLGSELVSCGSFDCANPDAVWTRGTGWGISGGIATYDGSGGTQPISQSIANVQLGTFCKVTIDVLSNQGSGANTIFLGNTVVNSSHLDVGSYTFYGSFSTNTNLFIYGRSNEVFEIDNVSVKEATIDGLARVDYTDGTASLLVEPQRTNLLPYSSDFTQWDKNSGTTITLDSLISPDGTQNADLIVASGSGSRVGDNVSIVSGTTYTLSVYLKNNGGNTSISMGSHTTTQLETITINDEWNRYTTTFVASSTTTSSIRIVSSGSNINLFAWGSQLEESSYPTSYIKTQGSSVTRNQDQYTKTGISDKINSEEGVLFTDIAALSDDGTNRIITLSDGSYNNSIRIAYYTNTNEIEIRLVVGGVIQVLSRVNIGNVLIFNKIAFKYKVNDFALWVNGTEIYSLSSGSTYASETLNRLAFDDGSSSNNFFGKVRQLQVFKTALSDSELATLTT